MVMVVKPTIKTTCTVHYIIGKTMEGYTHHFVVTPEDFVCMVCHHVAKDAQQVECCGKVFCKGCILEVKDKIGSCPNCRVKPPRIFNDIRSAREIKRLKITCGNEDRGCQWSGALESYETHEKECGYREVNCPNRNDGCQDIILKGFIDVHLQNACPRRKEKCTVCLEMVAHEDMSDHPNQCPKVEVECTNYSCSQKVLRGELSAHKNVCPKELISCPYSDAGCEAKILRKDKKKHLQDNIEQHSVVASNTVLALRKELKLANEALEPTRVPPITFLVSNYKDKKERRAKWVSPSFFSHRGGYKMEMKIYLNPIGDQFIGHVAVYCHLIPGVNDTSLQWPFKGTIMTQILNQNCNSGHHTKALNWGYTSGGVPHYSNRGAPKFIAHADLEKGSNHYVEGDCFYFRVLEVQHAKPWLRNTLYK